MKRFIFLLAIIALFISCSNDKTLYVLTTGDVHGAWLNKSYIDGQGPKTSLMSAKYYIDSIRNEVGKNNVLLLDAGDCLQGDNAAYYYNYVDTLSEHLFSRIVSYMGYDVIVVGNHDIETGHKVYDKVAKELSNKGIAYLAGNAIKENGESYFPLYKKFRKAGKNILVFGFTNPAIDTWLDDSLWSGMDFKSLLPFVQDSIDKVRAKEKADIVIVAVHSGTGEEGEEALESQGLELLYSLEGVDLIVTAHDHRQTAIEYENKHLINSGNKARYLGYAAISKDTTITKTIWLDKNKVDTDMVSAFEEDYQKVKAFTNQEIGFISCDLRSRDAFVGMSPYINLVHTVCLSQKDVQISFAAPLSQNGVVKAGKVIFNDLFTIYPFENQMFVVSLSGKEIKDYLEYSYNDWIQNDPKHILKIEKNGSRWNFVERSYNFDSAAGLIYTVDIKKSFGKRVNIKSLADGSDFDYNTNYKVAMTSYRANGGGGLLVDGAGIPEEELDSRVLARYPEIREMIGDYIINHPLIKEDTLNNTDLLGTWEFVPSSAVAKIRNDLNLMFK